MKLRPALMLGCAVGALTFSGSARAQAFNADPTTLAGTVSYDRATPGVETIIVDSPSAIIRWVPNVSGNPLIFLPAGRTATFTNGSVVGNFAVLNRIQTDVPVRFDGTVLSILQDFGTGTSAPGGTIVFESPNGIIVGQTAVFDVGNLILTSLSVTDDGAGNFIDPTGAIHFVGGDKFPKAAVTVLPGGQILASPEGSYVGLLAPTVQQGGTVRVNGSTAYVAAEAVDLRVNAGLFDIIVTAGSQNPVPLVHTGSTGGPASTGPGDIHRIYMVAVPKNTAITAILQGSVGFDPAVNVGVENGAIVLSAGYSVAGGAVDRFADFSPPPVADLAASFEIRGGTIRSDLFGYAVTNMLASGQALGSLTAQQDLSLFGGVQAALFAGPNQKVTVAGNLLVSTARNRTINLNPIDLAGGSALVFAQGGGSVDIFGSATIDSSAQGVVNVLTSTAGHGTGGTAGLFADSGGFVHVGGDIQLLATGAGGMLDLSPDRGGNGQGGTAFVEGRGGQVQLGGALTMDSSGTGSRSNGSVNPGATGTGGDAHVAAIGGGSVTVAGAASLTATGTGGEVTGGPISGGTGRGGTVSLAAAGTVTLNGDAVLLADAAGGIGPTGGIAQGGTINILASPVPGGTSALNAGNVTGSASATDAGATGNSPGDWHVRAGAGSSINLVNLTLTAATIGTPATLPFSSLEALRGQIRVTQIAALATPADIRVIGDGGGTILGGLLDLDSGRDVTVTHTSRGANLTIDVADLDIDGRNVTVAAGSATRASNRTDIAAGGILAVGGQMDGREIVATSASMDISGTGIVGSAATELADLRATGNAAVAGRVLGQAINLQGATVNVAATGAVGNGSTQQTGISATANAAVAGNVLGRTITVQGGAIDVAATGTIGGAGTDQARLTAAGNANVAGRVLGRDIRLASADIGLTGAVGDGSTQLVTLVAAPTGQAATLGGGAQGPGYTLTNAEAGRIRADTLRIQVPALGANPALFVRDVTFNGGGAAAGIGTLALATPGIARVEGNLLMANARAADGITFTATQRLEIVTPAGSVRVRDALGAPGGALTLMSNDIWAASAAIVDRLRLDANYAGRDADLLDNSGADVPRGYIEANGVALLAGATLFVQNSGFGLGTFATGLDFGGITVGPGGLTVRATGAGQATATAFGRRLNADGSFTTGYDFFFAVNFQPTPGNFTAGSTFNTCIIPTGQCPARPPGNAIPGRDPTTGPTGGSDVVQLARGSAADDLVDTSFAAEPLIEEPVTSGGESILWECERERDPERRCDGDRR